jgi:hypothetical protein
MCFDPPRVETLVKIDLWTCTMNHIMTKGYKKQFGLDIGGWIGGCKCRSFWQDIRGCATQSDNKHECT